MKYFINILPVCMVIFAIETANWMLYTGTVLAMIAAFALRIAINSKSQPLTKRSFTLQAVITISVCFAGYLAWRDYKIKLSLELYTFLISLFAVFIAHVVDDAGKVGIKNAVATVLKWLLGKIDSTEEKK